MLFCVSLSHRTTSFDLLERLSEGAPALGGALVDSADAISGAVVLATCNRFEAYLDIALDESDSRSVAESSALATIAAASGIQPSALSSSAALHVGAAAAEHLFAVSSGLESVVVGEGEIAGQVKRALGAARAEGTTTADLERVFQRASTASRSVQNSTGLGGAGRSIVRLALDLASSRLADWRVQRVLLVGTGAYAGASLAALRDRGVTDVGVYSPSGRAHRFGTREGVRAVTAGDLAAELAQATVIVSCSTANGYVVTADLLGSARDGSPLMVIDLGLPRNVEPAVAAIAGVELLDLETVRLHAPLHELTAAQDARELVGRAAAAYSAESTEHEVTAAVVGYRAHVFDLLDTELERLRARGESTEATERAMRHLASVLVHTPTARAKQLARDGRADEAVAAFSALFDIDAPTDPHYGLQAPGLADPAAS